MMELQRHSAGFEAPDLAPVLVTEHTRDGWRGLTGDGEILNVTAPTNGLPASIPESLGIARNGAVIGYRRVPQETRPGVIDTYVERLNNSTRLTRQNRNEEAYDEINAAMEYAPTMLARYNRAMILLALGVYQQGLDEFLFCEHNSDLFMRPQWRAARDAGMLPWTGQDIHGKTIVLLHDHGFGDTIMCLRFIKRLYAMGANVIVHCPEELFSIVQQHAPTMRELPGGHYFCSMFGLMQIFGVPFESPYPYIVPEPALVEKWRGIIPADRYKIGIACNVGKAIDGDYPRACPVEMFEGYLWRGRANVEIPNVEQGTRPCDLKFDSFADCAALMSLCDEIVTVDTAAVHLAGAIGHPKITLLLSHWHSWRWNLPLYANLKICVQDRPGDWDSAFAKLFPA